MTFSWIHCTIEEVSEWHPHLELDGFVVACVEVLSRHSRSPAKFTVELEGLSLPSLESVTEFSWEIGWRKPTEIRAIRLRATMQRRQLVEYASVALAFAILHLLHEAGKFQVSETNDGADYRSIAPELVLEVSGTDNLKELNRRHNL